MTEKFPETSVQCLTITVSIYDISHKVIFTLLSFNRINTYLCKIYYINETTKYFLINFG